LIEYRNKIVNENRLKSTDRYVGN